jgi:fumarate hydratase class II
MSTRIEKDTLGEVHVPADKFWGAQTERSRNNFKIGPMGSMPMEIVRAFAHLKRAAAWTNRELGVLEASKTDLIAAACEEILQGKLDDQFPWWCGKRAQGPRAT